MPHRIQKACNLLNTIKLEIISFVIALWIPIIPALMFIGFLIFADTLTGVWKAFKIAGWKNVKSRNLSDGVLPKITMYPLILLIASGCEAAFTAIPFIKGALFILMCIEIKSLGENIKVILKINIFSLIKTFILKGRKGLVESMLKDEE